VTESDLIELPVIEYGKAIRSEHLTHGVLVVMAYTEAWLRGVGCIPMHGKMEDAATAEISRAQLWTWAKHKVQTQDDKLEVTEDRLRKIVAKEVFAKKRMGGKWLLAGNLVERMLCGPTLDEFLTTVCYPHILTTAYAGTVIPDSNFGEAPVVPSRL